jgi:ketosteroid isomerase-like protein
MAAPPGDVDAAVDTVEAATGIDSLEARFIAAYNRDDPKALAETYTEDVRFIQDGAVEEGRAPMEEG